MRKRVTPPHSTSIATSALEATICDGVAATTTAAKTAVGRAQFPTLPE